MTSPIPNCPQPETPIRERAWTDEQGQAEPKYSDAEINVLATECEHGPSQAAVRHRTIANVLRSLLAERLASRPYTPNRAEVSGAVDRLREIAYRDEAKSVTVGADDLRAALTHFAAQSAEAVRDGERYRWLRARMFVQRNAGVPDRYGLADYLLADDITEPKDSKYIDRAIDAAMQEQSHD